MLVRDRLSMWLRLVNDLCETLSGVFPDAFASVLLLHAYASIGGYTLVLAVLNQLRFV